MPTPALVLLSGGLDSTTALYWALSQDFECHAVTMMYGQSHDVELEAAYDVAQLAKVNHRYLDLPAWGGSALNDPDRFEISHDGSTGSDEIPASYVPARNTVFLAHAMAITEAEGLGAVVMGVNAIDYSGYPDCRPEFIDAMQAVYQLGTKRGVEGRPVQILTPLISMTKANIVRMGLALDAPYELTHSCYDPVPDLETAEPLACGTCDSCRIRLDAFREVGEDDPIDYVPGVRA